MNVQLSTQIVFFYPVETMLDKLKLYEQTRGKFTESEVITDDELDLIHAEAEKAITDIFNTAYKLSKGITGSLNFNTAFSVTGTSYGECYFFRLNNYHGHNYNIVDVVDKNIEKLWTSMILQKWFLLTGKTDLAQIEQGAINLFRTAYNNSLTELYKPFINDVTPVYSSDEVEVDDETGEITEETAETTTMTDPLYFDTYSDFPDSGATDITYVDKQYGRMYQWNGSAYVLINSQTTSYSVSFESVSTVVVTHNLNKLRPVVQMTDADGNDWDVDYEATDENSGIVSWEGNKTGTLYLS